MISAILLECVFWTDLTFPSISSVVCQSVHLLIRPDQDKFPLHAMLFLACYSDWLLMLESCESGAHSVTTPTRDTSSLMGIKSERSSGWLFYVLVKIDLTLQRFRITCRTWSLPGCPWWGCSPWIVQVHWIFAMGSIVCLYVHKIYWTKRAVLV